MEEESMEVFCETIPAEDYGEDEHDEISDAEAEINDSFELKANNGEIKENKDRDHEYKVREEVVHDELQYDQAHDLEQDSCEEELVDDLHHHDDPTETLHKMMTQKSDLQMIPVKEEPVDREICPLGERQHYEESSETPTSDCDEKPVTSKKDGDGIKRSTTTRSGRKTSFVGVQRGRASAQAKGKKTPPASKIMKPSNKGTHKSDPVTVSKSKCLVCKAPCILRKNKKMPNYPFCKTCKKAYYYQQSINQGKQASKLECIKGGNCVIHYKKVDDWCTICHITKFNAILNSLRSVSDNSEDNRGLEFFNNQRSMLHDNCDHDMSSLVYDALKSSPSVVMERLSGEDLEQHGIELDPNIRETMNGEKTSRGQSKKTSSRKGLRKLGPKSKVNKRAKGIQSSSESDDETESRERVRKSYSLPAVNVGHKTVYNAVAGGPISEQKGSNKGSTNADNRTNNTEVLESIKVYVFTCGHACGLCNSNTSKEWLQRSGFYTTKPAVPHSSLSSSGQVQSSSRLSSALMQKSKQSNNLKSNPTRVSTAPAVSPYTKMPSRIKQAKSTSVNTNPGSIQELQKSLPTTATPVNPETSLNQIQLAPAGNLVAESVPNNPQVVFANATTKKSSNLTAISTPTTITNKTISLLKDKLAIKAPTISPMQPSFPNSVKAHDGSVISPSPPPETKLLPAPSANETGSSQLATPVQCNQSTLDVYLQELQKKGFVITPVTAPISVDSDNSTTEAIQSQTSQDLKPNMFAIKDLPPLDNP